MTSGPPWACIVQYSNGFARACLARGAAYEAVGLLVVTARREPSAWTCTAKLSNASAPDRVATSH